MSLLNNKFVVTRGTNNEFVFRIKKEGSTELINITSGDTFTSYLVKLSDQTKITSGITTTKTLGAGGKISVTINSATAASLETNRGDVEDRYYLLPTYKLVIEANTVDNGYFIAKVDEVYVD